MPKPLPGSSPWSYAARGIVGILFGAISIKSTDVGDHSVGSKNLLRSPVG